MKTIVVGDVHGCWEELIDLLRKCNVSDQDRVILLGDMVDRGPDNDMVVDWAIERELIQKSPASILGNHEWKHLRYNEYHNNIQNVVIPSHVDTRKQLKKRHYDYFARLPTFLRLPEYNSVCVHAGVWPNRSIEEQTKRHLTGIQSINPHSKSEDSKWPSRVQGSEYEDWKFWTNFWQGPERILFGHSVLDKPLHTEKFVGLDGGVCFGLELWALVLPENVIVKVESRSKQHDNRGRFFKIHDDVNTFLVFQARVSTYLPNL